MRHVVWILFSSFLCGLCLSTFVMILELAALFEHREERFFGWWAYSFVAGVAAGLAYHGIVSFNSRLRRNN